jgi:hypothetical protein
MRHHYVNAAAIQEFSNDILKRKIQDIIGSAATEMDAADVIDWEFAGVRTAPYVHKQED